MSKSYQRFEILLPLKFNSGEPVGDELIGTTLVEIRQRFGAISAETQTIHGIWTQSGEVYRDDLVRVFVDVERSGADDAAKFFEVYKATLKQRFQQLEIWITTYAVNVL
jgi:hypothetical protein